MALAMRLACFKCLFSRMTFLHDNRSIDCAHLRSFGISLHASKIFGISPSRRWIERSVIDEM